MHAKPVMPLCPAARQIWMDHGRCSRHPRHPRHPVTTAMSVRCTTATAPGCIPQGLVGSGMLAKELACSCQVPAYANGQPGRGGHGWHRADMQPTVEPIPYPDDSHGQIGTQTGLLGSSHPISTRGEPDECGKRDCLGKHQLFAHDVTAEGGSLRPRL